MPSPSATRASSSKQMSGNVRQTRPPPPMGEASYMMEPPETRNWCCECYDPSKELLEYDYTNTNPVKDASAFPRIRERGEYYIDSYNDQPWSWTFGTHERVRGCGNLLALSFCLRISFSNLVLSCRMAYGSIHRIKQGVSCLQWFGS